MENRKEYQKENGRGEYIHPDGMQVPGPSTRYVFFRHKPGPPDEVDRGAEKFTIEMGDVIKKVAYQAPNRFFWLDIFLPALVAELPIQFSITVKADFLMTFFTVRQSGKFN